MLIGLAVLTLGALLLAMQSSWEITWFPGLPNVRMLSRSSAEAEYRAVANAVAEVSWLRQLLAELHAPVSRTALVYCDNISTVYMS